MRVELIAYTPNPDRVVATSAKLCYSKVGVTELSEKMTDEQVQKFLKMLMSLGHGSPVEHASFTFAIEGISRACSHQVVRHRVASHSQQSQRYVKLDQFEYIIPQAIKNNEYAKRIFETSMRQAQFNYNILVEELMKSGKTEKEAIEDARYVFPNACETKMVVTMNARSLFNFFEHRCCNRAQQEIRDLANLMLDECKKVAPVLFSNTGAPCTSGKCPEGAMSCGKPIKR
jgi:thymidylate synthase (FAD)